MSTAPRRLGHLDGLRGLAALTVVCAHYVLAFQPRMYAGPGLTAGAPSFGFASWIAQTPLVVAFSPQVGVAIFFVLSGFVLAASVSAHPAPLAELAVRRWIRLTGPVVLTTLPVWLWLSTGWHPDTALAARNHSQWLGMNFTWVAWQANTLWLALYQAAVDVYLRNRHWWNTSLWTLQIELWGSLALFAAYAAAQRWGVSRRWRVAVAVLVAMLTWRGDYAGFAIGAALFELRPTVVARTLLAWTLGPPLLVLALLLGGAPLVVTGWTPYLPIVTPLALWTPDPLLFLHRLGAALLVAVVLFWRPLQALLLARPFAFLGQVSFMMYLCHVSLICTVGAWLVLHLMPAVGYNVACVLAFPGLLSVVLLVASLGTRWLDRPCIALAHRVGHLRLRRFSRAAPEPVPSRPG